jgi:SulP family sulfate permease
LPGVGLGLLVACVLFAINYSRLGMIKHVYSGAKYRSNVDRSLVEEKCLREKGDSIYIVQLQGYIFFGSAYPLLLRVQERLQARDLPAVRYVILDFAAVNGLDSSSVLSFSKLKKAARLHDATILAVNLLDSLAKLLVKGGVVDEAGARDVSSPCCFRSEDLDHALAWCEERLIEEAGLADEGQKRRFADHFGTYFPTAQSIERLMPYLERVEAAPSDVLFRQGTPSTDLYFVESGTVTTLLEISGQPAHKRLRTMGAGTVVGEMGLYLGRERTATVKAESRCVLYRLSSEALARLERDDVELASALHRFFVRLLSERLLHADEEIAHLVS